MIEEKGGKAVSLSRDLTDGQQVQSMVDAVVGKYGRIDILVNNAGGYPSEIYDKVKKQAIKIWEWSEAQWDQIIKTNLRIPFLCINKVVPVMIKQGGGNIVSVSSRMGRIASQMGAYAVAKGRAYHIDQDDCHPDAGVWHQSQCCLPRNCRYARTARI